MTDPTETPEALECRWPADGQPWTTVPDGGAVRPPCGSTQGTRVLTSPRGPGGVAYTMGVCGLHAGDAYRAHWHVVPEPPAEPVGLSINGEAGINAVLCRAFGADPEHDAGFRLTVLGGEAPALEVFRHPPLTPDGMYSPEPAAAVDELITRGARLTPPHLAMTEFTLRKLLLARDALRAGFMGLGGQPPDSAFVRAMAEVLAQLDAGLSPYQEAADAGQQPRVRVFEVTAVVDEDGNGIGLVPTDDAEPLPAGATVLAHLELIGEPDPDEPSLVEHDGPPTSREGLTGLVER